MRDYEQPQLFEIAWEVANKGIFIQLIKYYLIIILCTHSWWYIYGS
jgi:hypothetical protein